MHSNFKINLRVFGVGSGRKEASQPLSHLRTVRDNFTSYGSSVSAAKPFELV
ncbi:hypothetical protein [Desulforegula conservatrix]|uniref:hypothetical protein n=1 Tax=Desulforegula conservatrix TaxID=153026 RepID=UPI0018DD478E|nr:hypothetical protein [Desulforegula conservatrix]